jgi:hypothetical protein
VTADSSFGVLIALNWFLLASEQTPQDTRPQCSVFRDERIDLTCLTGLDRGGPLFLANRPHKPLEMHDATTWQLCAGPIGSSSSRGRYTFTLLKA